MNETHTVQSVLNEGTPSQSVLNEGSAVKSKSKKVQFNLETEVDLESSSRRINNTEESSKYPKAT